MSKPAQYTKAPMQSATIEVRVPLSLQEHPLFHFEAIISEVERLRDLGDDWDCEGAIAISESCVADVTEFLSRLDSSPVDDCSGLKMPEVNPTLEGGVQLYWFTEWGQTALTFIPGNSGVQMQRKELNKPGIYGNVAVSEADQIARQAIRSK